MVTRIVKMTFNKAFTDDFQLLFKIVQPKIAASPGCEGVSLFRDSKDANVFFTISYWADEAALDTYRNASLFTETWTNVKAHFSTKAEAWSLNSI